MRTLRGLILVAVTVLVVLGAARADILHLKSGVTFDGELIEKTTTHYVFKIRGIGVQKFKVSEVLRLEEKQSIYDEYAVRKKAVAGADGWIELGNWCRENGLAKEARGAFRAVLEEDPDHEGARAALGYQRISGKWLTTKQYRALRKRQERETASFLREHLLTPQKPFRGADLQFWAPSGWGREEADGGTGVLFTGPEMARVTLHFGIEVLPGTVEGKVAETRAALEGAGSRVEAEGAARVGTREARRFLSISGGEGGKTARLDAFAEGAGGIVHLWFTGPGRYPVILELLFADLLDAVSFKVPEPVKPRLGTGVPDPGGGWVDLEELATELRDRRHALLMKDIKDLQAGRLADDLDRNRAEQESIARRLEALSNLRGLGEFVICRRSSLAAIALIWTKNAGQSSLPFAPALQDFFKRNAEFRPDQAGPVEREVFGRPACTIGFTTKDGTTGWVALLGKGDLRLVILAVNFDREFPDAKLRKAFEYVLDHYRFG